MRILVTGACGFVGSRLLKRFREAMESATLIGLDNLCRPGSESNRELLKKLDVKFFHGDVRSVSDFESLPAVDWVIDAAANPSVLAGVDGKSSSRQVIEHNLAGTVNMLEYCKRHGAGFILLSTSRVYSVPSLVALPTKTEGSRFVLDTSKLPSGASAGGVTESFSTAPPLSLYGVSKKMSEDLALEYHSTFGLPVWVNRCGVMAGAGQFGRADQGIIAFWIHSWREGRPLRYLGFGGHGHQVRDCLHPDDLAALLLKQMAYGTDTSRPRLANVSGGLESAFSLAELSEWCAHHFGVDKPVHRDGSERPFDIAWLVLDDSLARETWDWRPEITRESLFQEVAGFASERPNWMDISAG
ncbi:NAD-dependent epimerase/dehydratase family protein [Phragmitibacter flavus]|uniref:NAD-dependent epimerase/dehydratase family protein n=1 Tax=Phragmitibacter flavus TaxID=2576071 RepID=A0A5R8KID0_9BACT|nr:NAD-dependent epimerase/dehydratase family protein [Phragmitibacter flavus]TLD72042.1 NAD-dependent epimerase/dehydratase family protein [Phragmitibacter flavus]